VKKKKQKNCPDAGEKPDNPLMNVLSKQVELTRQQVQVDEQTRC